MRLFVAVDIEDAVRGRVSAALPELRARSMESKWVKPENYHLTLAFLGQQGEEALPALKDVLTKVAASHGPLTLAVGEGGSFGRPRRPRVLWVDCRGEVEALARIEASLADALRPLGHSRDHEAYRPHLTLARARDVRGDAGLSACVEALRGKDFGTSRVASLVLYESVTHAGGPAYHVRFRAELAQAGSTRSPAADEGSVPSQQP